MFSELSMGENFTWKKSAWSGVFSVSTLVVMEAGPVQREPGSAGFVRQFASGIQIVAYMFDPRWNAMATSPFGPAFSVALSMAPANGVTSYVVQVSP